MIFIFKYVSLNVFVFFELLILVVLFFDRIEDIIERDWGICGESLKWMERDLEWL